VIIKLIHPTNAKNSTSTNSWWTRIRYSIPLLLIFQFSIFNILSCGIDIEDSTPPSPPKWIKKSLPEDWPERGIDAHESGGIYLEWEPSPQNEDIIAYNIYRATWYDVNDSLGEYDLLARLGTESIPELEYVDRAVNSRIKYFYALKSEDISDNLSEFSDSLYYSLLHPINSESMVPNGKTIALAQDRSLTWSYNGRIEMEDYCLTIITAENELNTRVLLQPGNYIGGSESWQILADIVLEPGNVYQWRVDLGAQYVDFLETAGSESAWATFLYEGD
jgi:hypothetical protein